MDQPKPLLNRAYELARSGDYTGLSDLRAKLKAEGYSKIEGELLGLGLRRQLKRLCDEARASALETCPVDEAGT